MWRVIVALSVVGFVLVFAGQSAWAAEWSPPVNGVSIALPFGAEYPGGTHRGVDLPADAGAAVAAPVAGRVAFAGMIPADGGGTCNAVTIETADGHKISLLPLESVHVRMGATICAGDTVGRLAASGDDSTGYPHLHLGLRQGDRYIDPSLMLLGGGGGEPVIPQVSDTAPEQPADPVSLALPEPGSMASVGLLHPPASVPLPEPTAASARLYVPSGQIEAPRPVSDDLAASLQGSTVGELVHAGDAVRTVPGEARAVHLVRDACVPASGATEFDSGRSGDAPGGATWISKRTGGVLGPVALTPLTYTLVALATAVGAVMPIIARSKALVRAR